MEQEKDRLNELISQGQLPISPQNIHFIKKAPDTDNKSIINAQSKDADLTIIGIRSEFVKHEGGSVFEGYEKIGNTLFVNAAAQKNIK